MIYVRVIGDKNEHLKNSTIETYSVLYILNSLCNEEMILLTDITTIYGMDLVLFKEQLKYLSTEDIINYSNNNKNEDDIIDIEIKKYEKVQERSDSGYLFGLSPAALEQLEKNSLTPEQVKLNTLILLNKLTLPSNTIQLQINNQDDMKKYLELVYPHEILIDQGLFVSKADLEFIYDAYYDLKMPRELINLAIDYTINKSTQKNFNKQFASKVLYDWKKKKITNLDDAFLHIKKINDKIKKKTNGYVEPEFMSVEIKEDINIDLEGLIKNAYDK